MGVINSTALAMACDVCGVRARGGRRDPRSKIRWMQGGMGVLEGTIARTTDSRHVGILSRVKAGWRRASNRVRVGAAAAAAIERQLNGFMGSWTGAGSASRLPNKVHSHVTKQINNEIVCQLYLDIPTQATTPATQCKRHILHGGSTCLAV
jgi:hypothetical protein